MPARYWLSAIVSDLLGGLHRFGLRRGFGFEDAQRGEIVLDVLECGERDLAIVRRRRIEAGARLRDLRLARAAVENRFGQLRARATRSGSARSSMLENVELWKPAGCRQGQVREKRGFGDADLRIRGGGLAFGDGDIGTALEQCRRQLDRNCRRRDR